MVPDILHKIGIRSASQDGVYKALTTLEGLASWWTTMACGEADRVGGVIQLRFNAGGFDMDIVDLEDSRYVLWRVVDGPEEWFSISDRKGTGRSSFSTIRAGGRSMSSCITAARNGPSSC
jgi:uncharacterized protein YndB with AHSA1/START domain